MKEFMIYPVDEVTDFYTVTFDITGVDAQVYTPLEDVDITIVGEIAQIPAFIDLIITATRREAHFIVNGMDTTGILYFQVELKYRDPPTPEEIFENFSKGHSLRYNIYDAAANVEAVEFDVEGLAAGTEYVVYMILADLSDSLSILHTETFFTLPDHNSV